MTASTATAPSPAARRPRPTQPVDQPARPSGLRAAWGRHRAARASLRQYRALQRAAASAPTPSSASEISALLARR